MADELERRWNQALERMQAQQAKIEQHVLRREAVTIPWQEESQDLAADLEAVWNADAADVRRRKRIVRTLISEIVVDVDANAGKVIRICSDDLIAGAPNRNGLLSGRGGR